MNSGSYLVEGARPLRFRENLTPAFRTVLVAPTDYSLLRRANAQSHFCRSVNPGAESSS